MPSSIDLTQRRAIVFDFDGTIANTTDAIISTATKVLTDFGVPRERLSRVGEIIGPPFPQAFEQEFDLSHDDAVEVTARYRAIYAYLGVEAWPAFPRIPELLRDLRDAGRLLAVASSKRADLVCKGLSDNDLLELFHTVRAKQSDEEGTKTEAIMAAIADMGATLEQAVMVGDRFHDVEAAALCGVPCIGVRYGETARPGELEDAGAIAIAHTVDELRTLLLGPA